MKSVVLSFRKDVYSGDDPSKKDKRSVIDEKSQLDYFLFRGTKYI